MSAATTAEVDALLERRGPAVLRPPLDPAALRRLPPGSFGRAFIDFCDAHALTPVTITDAFAADDLRRLAAVTRYIVTHDMLHVLLDRDTSIPGELGVSGFALGQGYFRAARLIFGFQAVVASLMRPHQALRSVRNLRAGYRLGRATPNLLAQPLEDFFADDLAVVRRRLGLSLERPDRRDPVD